jgi:hypothetical protein
MTQQWFVSRSGSQEGPFTSSQLKVFVQEQKISPDDLVWKEGMAEWVPASRVKGLFPISPPPPPSQPVPSAGSQPQPVAQTQSAIQPDPILGQVVTADGNVNDAWKSRESPMGGHVGILGGLLNKQINERLFTHKVYLFKKCEDGRVIERDEVVEQLGIAFRNRGFDIQSYPSAMIAIKRSKKGTLGKIDTSPDALTNVCTHTNALIRVAETDDRWILEAKCEAFFWPKVMDQLAGAAGMFILALIFFWPCLCLIPFAFAVDADEVRQKVEEDVKAAMERVTIDFA